MSIPGTLYIVATPLGNLKDITLRALEVLREADIVLAEDTRVTAKLLAAHGVKTPLKSYHQHSGHRKTDEILDLLRHGKALALVSDAGTPGINDPGGMLIAAVLEVLLDVRIVPIPGPNAAVAALSISGFPADQYVYRGFVPHKKGRKKLFRSVAEESKTQVFYESKHRITKTLTQLAESFTEAGQEERRIMIARELTKRFETVLRGTARDILEQFEREPILGEFVIVVGPAAKVR